MRSTLFVSIAFLICAASSAQAARLLRISSWSETDARDFYTSSVGGSLLPKDWLETAFRESRRAP